MKKEHPYRKLKEDYDHLLGRTLELFELGLKKERDLETVVANAEKMCIDLLEVEDLRQIKSALKNRREFFTDALRKHNKTEI